MLLPLNNLLSEDMNFEYEKYVTKFSRGILILSPQWGILLLEPNIYINESFQHT
jgi:hypothetical protein